MYPKLSDWASIRLINKRWKMKVMKVIIDCKTTEIFLFRTKLGFDEHDIMITKKKSVLTKITNAFEGENMQTQYSVLLL